MNRFFTNTRMLIAALILACVTTSVAPPAAMANGGMGGGMNNGGTGRLAYVYVVNVYYSQNGQWQYYGRYFATKYSGGGIDWGGADGAVQRIRASGAQANYTYSFWRITNNG